MPYVSKGQRGHDQWVGLAELLEIVQAESGCDAGAAQEQIRNALADSEIWPLDWEPAPTPNAYCHPKYGPHAAAFKKPVSPPPPSLNALADFRDRRSALHWRAIRIDWEQGRVLDDFEHEAYQRLGRYVAVPGDFEPTQMPRPQRRPEWRTLMLDREACERLWPSQLVGGGSSEPRPPMSPVVLREWVDNYIQNHVNAGTTSNKQKIWADFKADPNVRGRATRDRVWGMYTPPSEWTKRGRPPRLS